MKRDNTSISSIFTLKIPWKHIKTSISSILQWIFHCHDGLPPKSPTAFFVAQKTLQTALQLLQPEFRCLRMGHNTGIAFHFATWNHLQQKGAKMKTPLRPPKNPRSKFLVNQSQKLQTNPESNMIQYASCQFACIYLSNPFHQFNTKTASQIRSKSNGSPLQSTAVIFLGFNMPPTTPGWNMSRRLATYPTSPGLPSSRGEAVSLPLTSPGSDSSHSGEHPWLV